MFAAWITERGWKGTDGAGCINLLSGRSAAAAIKKALGLLWGKNQLASSTTAPAR
jgi:hypothetical protein